VGGMGSDGFLLMRSVFIKSEKEAKRQKGRVYNVKY